MCGIAGFAGKNADKILKNSYNEMLHSMKGRGPDSDGIKEYTHAVLLHSRLAVIDPENGKQPMTAYFEGAEYTIVYNGELYNTEEIRNKLKEKGIDFETQSDTEVVLKAYIIFGESALEKFNGIYAFAVWNERDKTLFIARDRMGVKPFFYTETKEGFLFASEIKTIFASGLITPKIDKDGISDLILIAPGRTPGEGVFKGIRELKAGHCGTVSQKGIEIHPYFEIKAVEHTDNLAETISKVNSLLRDSIHRQLVSDVPIGTFLSGGLDSSLISSVANRYMKRQGKRLITFSVGYKDNSKYFKKSHFQPNSDEEYIKQMCEYLDCDHIDITIDTPELAAALERAVDARDLPGMADVDSSLLLFCKEIKKYVTVALSGECADEIFGGYPWYRDREVLERYGFPWSNNYEYRASFLNDDIKVKIKAREYVSERYEKYCAEAPKIPNLSPHESRMREMSYLNMHWFMQTLLDRKDRMSMYSGLEVRVPFCDHRIAEYMYNVPWSMKDLNGFEKGLLRTAFEGYLPEEVLYRKKSPYPKTHNPAYMSAVCGLLAPVLDNPNEPIHKILSKDKMRELFDTQNPTPWYGQLMTTPQTVAYFYMLNYWLKKYNVEIEI